MFKYTIGVNLQRSHFLVRSLASVDRKWTGRTAVVATVLLALALFLSTLQWEINGSANPYATDVGEIQNALPRWGTLHFTGYPQYSAIGSAFVTLLRLLGIAPAAGASLYSAVWGVVTLGLFAALALTLAAPPVAAVTTALLLGLSTSMWVDASIAEVHTMTMALTLAALLAAVRFRRSGQRGDLYWLAFLAGQGLAHQRAFLFLGPALLALALPRWRTVWQERALVIGLGLLGPLTYLYLPLRAWMGADWTFSAPGTWDGFWALVLDTKAERIVEVPQSAGEVWRRAQGVFQLLSGDWPLPLWLLGLAGLVLSVRDRIERLALSLSWLAHLAISLIIWEDGVSDALLAIKMPVIAMAALGLAFITQVLWRRWLWGQITVAVWLAVAAWLYVDHRPEVVAVTRDSGARATIALAAQIPPAPDGRPGTLMALWGNDFWQLAYAQRYQGKFSNLRLVDHDADFAGILAEGHHLLTLSRTLYQRPPEWWTQLLGPIYLSSVAPEVVEIATEPVLSAVNPDTAALVLENGIAVRRAQVKRVGRGKLVVTVAWQAQRAPAVDYSVAIHLVSEEPVAGPQDIIAQADERHPVDGWYPTSDWQTGEIVTDHYGLIVPGDAEPEAVRISMYRVAADGGFEDSGWLSLPLRNDN